MAKILPKLPFLLEVRLMVVGAGVGAEDGDMMLIVTMLHGYAALGHIPWVR